MRKHRRTLIAVSCLALLVGAVAVLSRNKEPQYRGRPLSYWAYLYTACQYRWPHPEAPNAWPRKDEARQAVLAIGPAAVPYFVEWLGYEPSPLRSKYVALAATLPKGPWSRWLPDANAVDKAWLRAISASVGLRILGPAAASAAPNLLRLANRSRDPAAAQQIAQALASLGPQGILALSELLTNTLPPTASITETHVRFEAISQLAQMGTLPAIPDRRA